MDWSAMLRPEIGWLEKLVRPLVVYGFLLVAFRLAGKRELAHLTPFDLIVLLTISNAVQNAMIGPDDSLTGGLIGAFALIVTNGVLTRLNVRSRRIERLLSGRPTPLIENGRVLHANVQRELMTPADLEHALRANELDPDRDLPRVRRAMLETDGMVTVLRTDSTPSHAAPRPDPVG
jgi:uncharacterized membrane protein YcaP (DUF421 family)